MLSVADLINEPYLAAQCQLNKRSISWIMRSIVTYLLHLWMCGRTLKV